MYESKGLKVAANDGIGFFEQTLVASFIGGRHMPGVQMARLQSRGCCLDGPYLIPPHFVDSPPTRP